MADFIIVIIMFLLFARLYLSLNRLAYMLLIYLVEYIKRFLDDLNLLKCYEL